MEKIKLKSKRKIMFILIIFILAIIFLIIRVFIIQMIKQEELQNMAYEMQTRDRLIKPERGSILDRNGNVLAKSATVNSIGVVHNQIKDFEKTATILSEYLEINYDDIYKKINKNLALERIKSGIDKDIADKIRLENLDGVKIDEDFKRYYPYSNLASHTIGFVGKDNQGIIGLEVKYDEYLKGQQGKILIQTDGAGVEIKGESEERIEPVKGYNLVTSIDLTVQQYAEQELENVLEQKGAKKGTIIVMNPQNGEIYAMVNKPDYDLNEPFTINDEDLKFKWKSMTSEERNKSLNHMWRNFAINDTYEPGSTFKIITSIASLEENVVSMNDTFYCKGYSIVGNRMIKCWKYPNSHGSESFVQGVQNSCNVVFMELAQRLGVEKFYKYFDKLGFNDKTGIDLPGEAVGIVHDIKNVGPVELATMSFGQSFQITPLQLVRAVAAVINGGYEVEPHFGLKCIDDEGIIVEEFDYGKGKRIVSEENSKNMTHILESVVAEGTGNKAYIPGYRIGGKTATSEKLPRKNGKYIASFLAFAPAENPQVIALVLIDEPQGVYYGGTVAGPVMKSLFSNILPYLGIEPIYNEKELDIEDIKTANMPYIVDLKLKDAEKILKEYHLEYQVIGDGDIVKKQFPLEDECINIGEKVFIYTD